MTPPVSDVLRSPHNCETHPLDVFAAPESVALFGGSEAPGTVGRALLFNLVRYPFSGVLFPISEEHSSLLGVRAYPSLAAAPAPVDLALVATPAPIVPDILAECQNAGVKAAIVLAPSFSDSRSAGADIERRIRQRLQHGSMRVLGLNSFGIVLPRTGFNATFTSAMVPSGKVGFLTQSGALLTALLHQEHSERLGCSAVISVGSLIDIGWTEWLDYLARDPATECIGIFLERLEDARSFFTAVREVAPHKPIVLVKGGRASQEDPARDEIFAEACRCNGVLLVQRLADLFRMAGQLPTQPVARGRRLAIVSNVHGPALLAADALHREDGYLAPLAARTMTELDNVLAGQWNHEGPIDIGDEGDTSQFVRAANVTASDPNVDALLLLLAPQSSIDPLRATEELRRLPRVSGKPVLACWLWGAASPESLAILRDAGIPHFHSPEAAVRAFSYLCRHGENLRFLAEIREALVEAKQEAIESDCAARVRIAATRAGRTFLTEAQTMELFAAYGLPMQRRRVAWDEMGAIQAANESGYPVILELGADSQNPDSCEVVRLKAADAADVRRVMGIMQRLAREHFGTQKPAQVTVQPLIPSSAVEAVVTTADDQDLGPVIRLGLCHGCVSRGGFVTDRPSVAALAPLTQLSIREMIEHGLPGTLAAQSGGSPEFEALERFLLRLSRLVVEQRWIREVTIESLVVWEQGVLARDVCVRLAEEVLYERA